MPETPPPACATCQHAPVDQDGDTCLSCQRAPAIFAELCRRRMLQLGLNNQDELTDSFNDCVWHHLELNRDPELAAKIAASKRPDLPVTKSGIVYWLRGNSIDPVWWPAFSTWFGVDTVEFYTLMGLIRVGHWAQVDEIRARWFAPLESNRDRQQRFDTLTSQLEQVLAQVASLTGEVVRLKSAAGELSSEEGFTPGDQDERVDNGSDVTHRN